MTFLELVNKKGKKYGVRLLCRNIQENKGYEFQIKMISKDMSWIKLYDVINNQDEWTTYQSMDKSFEIVEIL